MSWDVMGCHGMSWDVMYVMYVMDVMDFMDVMDVKAIKDVFPDLVKDVRRLHHRQMCRGSSLLLEQGMEEVGYCAVIGRLPRPEL